MNHNQELVIELSNERCIDHRPGKADFMFAARPKVAKEAREAPSTGTYEHHVEEAFLHAALQPPRGACAL